MLEWTADPQELGLNRQRFHALRDYVTELVDYDHIPAIALTVGTARRALEPWCLGRIHPNSEMRDRSELSSHTPFIVTSLTKPIITAVCLRLLEQGKLSLSDRLTEIIPEFRGGQKRNVRLLHLLTHTSGLPALLPNDRELRVRNATLPEFLSATCELDLLAPPGSVATYSNCGFHLMGEALSRVAHKPLPQLVATEVFNPLGMRTSNLGENNASLEENRFAHVRVPEDQANGNTWNWNSPYWRSLGAPWGGLVSTVSDLALFCSAHMQRVPQGDIPWLSPATREMATRNTLPYLPDLAPQVATANPWGLGWRLHSIVNSNYFGDLAPIGTFGHWGASGTVFWIYPQRNLFAVVLTTQPQDPSGTFLTRISNIIHTCLDTR